MNYGVTDLLGELLVHSPFSKQGQLEQVYEGCLQMVLNIWKDGDSTVPLGILFQVDHPYSENEHFFS